MIWKWYSYGLSVYLSSVQIKVLILEFLVLIEVFDNIYDRSISTALYLDLYFFSSFWRLWKIIFLRKNFQNCIFVFSFYPKNSRTGSRKTSITQKLFVIESWPSPRWVAFLIFCQLVFDVSSHFNDLILAWSTSLQVSHQNSETSNQEVSYQNSRLVYEIFQFLKQAVSATWHGDS